MKKKIIKKALFSIAICSFTLVISGCKSPAPKNPEIQQIGMFEWDESSIDRIEEAEELVDELNITHWYQEMEMEGELEELKTFIKAMSHVQVSVFTLVGETEWGYEEDGASLISHLRKIAAYNKSVSEKEQIKGVMVDIEPYVLKKWEKDKEKNMDVYVSGMIKAYEYAKRKNLIFSICIPRHYDDQGLTTQLETLIAKGCDEVAVMNYDCGLEVEKIETEAVLTQKYGKVLHCILEFQDVGKHGLVEEKTYRNKGLKAAWAAWDEVAQAYEGLEITRDYHWTEPIWKILKEEEAQNKSE